MGILDKVIGIGGDALGQWVTGKNQEDRASTAWNREKAASAKAFKRSYNAYKMRYQDTTADMRKAGLNPIMAASGGFNVGNSVTYPKANAPMAQSPNYQFTSSAKNWSAADKNTAEAKKAMEQIPKIRAEAKKAIAETYVARAKKGLIKAQEREVVKRILKIEEEIWNIAQDTEKKFVEGLKIEDEIKLIQKRTTALRWQMEKLKDLGTVYKGPLGKVLAYIQAIMSSFGAAIHGGAGMTKLIK